MLKADLSVAIGSIRCPDLWEVLRMKVGASSALACMKAIMGHGIVPEWMAIPGTSAPIRIRCEQGAPESFVLWNLLVDEGGMGIDFLALEADPRWTTAKN